MIETPSKLLPQEVVAQPDPNIGSYKRILTLSFTSLFRPIYLLSLSSTVFKFSTRPKCLRRVLPRAKQRSNRSKIELLDANRQEAMRKICELAREVLDIVAAALTLDVTMASLHQI